MRDLIWKLFIVLCPVIAVFGCAKTPNLNDNVVITATNQGRAEANIAAAGRSLDLVLPELNKIQKKYVGLAKDFLELAIANTIDTGRAMQVERNDYHQLIEIQKGTIQTLATEKTILKSKWYVINGERVEWLWYWWKWGMGLAIVLRVAAWFTTGIVGTILAKSSKYLFIVLTCGVMAIHEFLSYVWKYGFKPSTTTP